MEYFGTFGPKCHTREQLKAVLEAGMTGIRLNLSHKNLEECSEWLQAYQEAQQDLGMTGRLLIDLRGPELRLGDLEETVFLDKGQEIWLDIVRNEPKNPGAEVRTVEIPTIPVPKILGEYLQKGQNLLINDGMVRLEVTEEGPKVKGCILRGGEVASRKSIALEGVEVPSPTLTPEDLENLKVAEFFQVTDVMLPFVRGKEDIQNLRQRLHECGVEKIQIHAKIENKRGVEKLEEILDETDAVVIARGDLGQAYPLWELPVMQKEIAGKCRKKQIPFMVVTQMLQSMIKNPVPTRAEVMDIYNAVADGAASLMLTGETAVGEYPEEAMKYLVKTAETAGKNL